MANENDIGGRVELDITSFKTNISELNRQIKVIDTGFKAASAGLDDWSKSEDGLKLRMQSLSETTDLQRKKIENLNEIYKKTVESQGDNSKAAQNLQVQINKETEALNKNSLELKKSEKALYDMSEEAREATKKQEELEKSLESSNKRLKDLGGNIAKAAAAGIAAVGAAAIAAAGSLIKAATSAADYAGDIDDAAQRASTTAEAFQEYAYAAKLSGLETDALEKAMIKQQKAFSDAKEGSKATGEAYQRLGIDINNIGSSADAFDAVIYALADMQDETERNTLANDIFGKSYADLAPLLNSGSEGIKALRKEAVDLGGVMSNEAVAAGAEFGDTLDKLKTSVSGVTRTIGSSLFQQLAPAIEDITKKITESLPKISESIKNIDFSKIIDGISNGLNKAIDSAIEILPKMIDALGWIMDNADKIALGAAAIGSAMVGWKTGLIIADVVGWVKKFTIATEGATIAQKAFNLATKANVIGAVVAVIALLIGYLIHLWKTNEDFRNAVISAWDAIKTAGVAVWEWLSKFFTEDLPNAINSAIEWFKSLPDKVGEFFGKIPDVVSEFLSKAIDKISEWGTNVLEWIQTEVPKFIQRIVDFFNELPGNIGYALGEAVGTLIKFGIDAWDWAKETIPKIIDSVITFFAELPGKIENEFNFVMNKIGEWGASIKEWIIVNLPIIISNIVTFFSELPGKVGAFFSDILTDIKTWASNALTTAKEEIPKIIDSITGFFETLPDKLYEIGENIVKGLWNGISSMGKWLKNKGSEFVDGFVGGIKDTLGIQSPSTVMRDEVGKMIGAGMAVGIDDSAKRVNAAMAGLNRQLSTDGQVSMNTSVSGSNNSNQSSNNIADINSAGSQDLTINIPLSLDGSIVTKTTSRIQIQKNLSKSRSLGVALP